MKAKKFVPPTADQMRARFETVLRKFPAERLWEILALINLRYDGVSRLAGGQSKDFVEMLHAELQRTQGFTNGKVLANDEIGYAGTEMLAILFHPCQQCAEDPEAWHTRPAFCEHNKRV